MSDFDTDLRQNPPYVLAILRIVTALLFLEHATMKFFQFPAVIQGVTYPLPAIMLAAGAIEIVTVTYYRRSLSALSLSSPRAKWLLPIGWYTRHRISGRCSIWVRRPSCPASSFF